MRIYLDLDGVMCDFEGHFLKLFGFKHNSIPDNKMWEHINSVPTFFLDADPFENAKKFFNNLTNWDVMNLEPTILTACPKSNYENAALQKKQWVRNHLSETATILPVLGGKNKYLFMHQKTNILIDDFEKNIVKWNDAGGIGILHTSYDDTLEQLKRYG